MLQAPALDLFHIMGSASLGKFNYLIEASDATKKSAFILESLTVDYAQARYYLYAENQIYEGYWATPKNSFIGYFPLKGYSSSGWKAETVPPQVYSNPRLDIFFHNRKFLYSARAGNPEIIEQFGNPISGLEWRFMVVGQHSYYDPASSRAVTLPRTRATDCNLGEWGFENR